MNAVSVRDPITGVDYLWPKAKNNVQFSDTRRVNVQHVPGADGASTQYGLNPFPRDATTIQIGFRVTPRASGTTFDALRRALNLAIDSGLPQRITFVDDMGKTWYATAYMTAKDLSADENRQWWADWKVTFIALDPLSYGPLAGVIRWGEPGLKWGATGRKWGETPHTVPLDAASVPITIPNPDGTAETRDMTFVFTGQWGADVVQGSATFSVANNSVVDLNTGHPVSFSVADAVLAGHTYMIDIGTGGTYKGIVNGDGSITYAAVLGGLTKPPLQYGYMRFRPNGDNDLVASIGGTPLATLNGTLLVSWRPKAPLA